MGNRKITLKDKLIIGTIVFIVGVHILNWEMQGIGWKGDLISKFKQCLLLPWSLI